MIRDTDVEFEDEAEDLVRSYEAALKQRRRGEVVDLSIDADMPARLRELVVAEVEGADPDEVHLQNDLQGIVDVKQLIVDARPDLLFPSNTPRSPQCVRDYDGDCFAAFAPRT